MALPVTVLRRNSGTNLVGRKTSSSKTYGRAEQVAVQASAALDSSVAPIVAPSGFTGSTLVVGAAVVAAEGKMVLLSGKVGLNKFGVATPWAIVETDTSGKAHGDKIYMDNTTAGVLSYANTSGVQVGYVLGDAATKGYLYLEPGRY